MAAIGIISDFGKEDPYLGSIKGKILSINPEAKIVDISNEIPPYCLKNASFILSEASKTFPPGSTLIAMIKSETPDEKKYIFLQTDTGLNFIGPNNGVFTLIDKKYNLKDKRIISNDSLIKAEAPTKFSEKNIIAPIATHLDQGMNQSDLGPKIESIELLDIIDPKIEDEKIKGEILNIDRFGNLTSNIPKSLVKKIGTLGEKLEISINGTKLSIPFLKSFEETQKGRKLCYIGTSGNLEIAKNQESLAHEINTEITDEPKIEVAKDQ